MTRGYPGLHRKSGHRTKHLSDERTDEQSKAAQLKFQAKPQIRGIFRL